MRRSTWLTLLLAVAAGACGERQAEPQDPRAAAADSVTAALAMLTPETFDTVRWVADSAAISRGAVVWTYSCRKCHGNEGRGDGGWVQDGDTLRPPSFAAADWKYGSDREGLRTVIFTGTDGHMPHWGLVGLKPRDVDAVTHYITKVLRP